MTPTTGCRFISYRNAARILASAVLVACLSLSGLPAAHAQESAEPAWSLKRLFTSRKAEPEEPQPEAPAPAAAAAKKKARVTREPIDPQATIVAKQSDAKVVMVIGDFLGSGLAEGLSTAFVDNPHVRVVDRTNGSSGFVRDDFYDWPAKVGGLIDAENPAAIVVMMGANDRQQMSVDGAREAVRSEAWNKAYAARTQALAKAISSRKVPFIWVGVPSFKSSRMLLDMLAFNEMFRAAATGAGAEYVDIWDGFVDEDGAYVSNGPDLNGQPARLRAADGINLARPGKRKLAFYAEKPLAKLLGDAAIAPAAIGSDTNGDNPADMSEAGLRPSISPEVTEVVIGPSDLGPIEPGMAVSLRSPALDGGTELLGLVPETRDEPRTVGEMLASEGIAPAAVPGRADDFSWPQAGATAIASAFEPPKATTGKRAAPAVLVAFAEPATPSAPLAMIMPLKLSEAEPAVVPTALPVSSEQPEPEVRAPVVATLADAVPFEDLTIAAKGAVSLLSPDDIADKSPSRSSPTALPRLPTSSGPAAEGAPTELPLLPVELPPLTVEAPAPVHAAPTIVASLPAATPPAGKREPAPGILGKAAGDAAPAPSPTPRRAVRLRASSGPAALAAPLAPTVQPTDQAEAKLRIGQIASTDAVSPIGRGKTPTDPDSAATSDVSPLRAAPAKPEEPPVSLPSADGPKAPPALIGALQDAAPVSGAPAAVATATVLIEPIWGMQPAPVAPEPDRPIGESAPAARPAPTDLPTTDLASVQIAPPALAVPPATNFFAPPETEDEPAAALPLPVEPVANSEPTSSNAISSLQPDSPEPVLPAAPSPAAAVAPAILPEQPAGPIIVPEVDISSLQSVPPDLAPEAPVVAPAEDAPVIEAPAPVAAPAPGAEPESGEAIASLKQDAPKAALPGASQPDPTEPVLPAAPAPAAAVAPAILPEQPAGPIIVPEVDISSLQSVPPDLAPEAPVVAPAEDTPVIEAPAPVAAPAPAGEPEGAQAISSLESKAPETLLPDAPEPAPAEAVSPAILPQQPAGPVIVPEPDIALPRTVPADLVSPQAVAAPAESPNTVAAPPPLKPVAPAATTAPESGKAIASLQQDATAPALLPAANTPPVDDGQPVAKDDLAEMPIIVPAIDVSSLQTVPPDLLPGVPVVTSAEGTPAVETPAPAAAPAPAGAPDSKQVISSLQPTASKPELLSDTKAAPDDAAQQAAMPNVEDKPIIVPEIDVSSLQTVPPDLMPAPAAKEPDVAPIKSDAAPRKILQTWKPP